MSELGRYLLPTERCVALARRHWAILLPQACLLAASWIAWALVLNATDNHIVSTAGGWFFAFSGLWMAWLVLEWWCDQFAVTDKRVLLVTGLLYKRVAVMPLRKVTDLTYERSPLGRLLGYGTFIMESAGQDQALSRVDHLRNPQRLYLQMSEELFGARRGSDGPVATTDRLPRL